MPHASRIVSENCTVLMSRVAESESIGDGSKYPPWQLESKRFWKMWRSCMRRVEMAHFRSCSDLGCNFDFVTCCFLGWLSWLSFMFAYVCICLHMC